MKIKLAGILIIATGIVIGCTTSKKMDLGHVALINKVGVAQCRPESAPVSEMYPANIPTCEAVCAPETKFETERYAECRIVPYVPRIPNCIPDYLTPDPYCGPQIDTSSPTQGQTCSPSYDAEKYGDRWFDYFGSEYTYPEYGLELCSNWCTDETNRDRVYSLECAPYRDEPGDDTGTDETPQEDYNPNDNPPIDPSPTGETPNYDQYPSIEYNPPA